MKLSSRVLFSALFAITMALYVHVEKAEGSSLPEDSRGINTGDNRTSTSTKSQKRDSDSDSDDYEYAYALDTFPLRFPQPEQLPPQLPPRPSFLRAPSTQTLLPPLDTTSAASFQAFPGPLVDESQEKHDFDEVKTFRDKINRLFPELVQYANEKRHDSTKFIEQKLTLENRVLEMGVAFSKMTRGGNLFRSEIIRPFHTLRSLFSLLQYHNALERRFATGRSPTTVSENGIGTSEGTFALKIVQFELSLFTLFRSDTLLDTTADDFPLRIQAANSRFVDLMASFQQHVSLNTAFGMVWARECNRVKEILRGFIEAHARTVVPKTPTITTDLNPPSTPSNVWPTDTPLPSNVSQLEEVLNTIRKSLAQCYKGGHFDARRYGQVKRVIERLKQRVEASELPAQAKAKVHVFVAGITPDLRRLDMLEVQNRPNQPTIHEELHPVSSDSPYFHCYDQLKDIKDIEFEIENLSRNLMCIDDFTSAFDVEVFWEALQAQRSRVGDAIQKCGEGSAASEGVLETLKQKTRRVASKIELLEQFLTNSGMLQVASQSFDGVEGSLFQTPSAPELDELDTLSQGESESMDSSMDSSIDTQLQEMEAGLKECMKRPCKCHTGLQDHVVQQRQHFNEIMQEAAFQNTPLTDRRKLQIAKIGKELDLLEQIFGKLLRCTNVN
ncbi:hypothetical protein JCM33374_g3844 [Metschnikowia sp. JCM 33374]|nr:hypothetical protein JCM33374_g3844 [Metschnikowia sp. JCM 33374]